ncbi:MAG: hypothetical protein ABEJ56_00795 [Candidatus Nanohaloarchaea archaeon]
MAGLGEDTYLQIGEEAYKGLRRSIGSGNLNKIPEDYLPLAFHPSVYPREAAGAALAVYETQQNFRSIESVAEEFGVSGINLEEIIEEIESESDIEGMTLDEYISHISEEEVPEGYLTDISLIAMAEKLEETWLEMRTGGIDIEDRDQLEESDELLAFWFQNDGSWIDIGYYDNGNVVFDASRSIRYFPVPENGLGPNFSYGGVSPEIDDVRVDFEGAVEIGEYDDIIWSAYSETDRLQGLFLKDRVQDRINSNIESNFEFEPNENELRERILYLFAQDFSQRDIAEHLDIGKNKVQDIAGSLKEDELIDTRRGPGGGTFLTDAGRLELNRKKTS